MNRHRTLDQLHPAATAIVISVELGFEIRERLAALGLKAGRELRLMHRIGAHGPLQVRVGSTDFILRPREAAGIRVQHASGG